MSVAKVSAAQAREIMDAQRAKGIAVPKPVAIARRKKFLKRGAPPKRYTPIRRGKPPAAMSEKRKARVKAWPEFKMAIYEIHGGLCYWHKGPCAFENGTAEHLVPWELTHRDVETLTAWICHRGFPASCHGAKVGVRGQVIALRYQVRFYGVEGLAPPETPDAGPTEVFVKDQWVAERDALWRIMNDVQEQIWNGTRPSKLPERFLHLSRRP